MLSLKEEKAETLIKKSKFIAYSFMVTTRDDVKDDVAKLRRIHPQATHICYGYIGGNNDDFGYFDDGEPSGTAGKQIYSAILNAKLTASMVAVVRYFGGIKLGVGGLSRAYGNSAKSVIEKAIVKIKSVVDFSAESSVNDFKNVKAYLLSRSIEITKIEYNQNVRFAFTADDDISGQISPLGAKIISKENKFSEDTK